MKIFNREIGAKAIRLRVKTGTAASNAITIQGENLMITTESLTTAQNALYTLTITNASIKATSMVFVTVGNGSNTQGTPMLTKVTPAAGSCVLLVANKHASAEAFNGTLKIGVMVVNPLV